LDADHADSDYLTGELFSLLCSNLTCLLKVSYRCKLVFKLHVVDLMFACAQELSDDTMLKIAAEMNLSETAFVRVINDGDTFATGTYMYTMF
jgi:Phenazine biosynthesis-like protein